MLKKITKILLYLTIFLLPLFVLPITNAPLMWNKHILLLTLSCLALILWLVRVMKTGELKLNWTKLSTAVLILLAVLGLATIFSAAGASSFWSALSPGSYLNFILYIIIFFLASNIFNKNREIIRVMMLLLISGTIVNLLFLSQLFFKVALPWDFAQTAGFNLVGSTWTLAIFFGGLAIILLCLLGSSKIFKHKYYQILGCLALILFLVSLIIIDLPIVWIGIALAMIIIIWQKLKEFSPAKEKLEAEVAELATSESATTAMNLKPVYLPAIIFIVAIILIVIRLPLAGRFTLPNLITLNNSSTHEIVGGSFGDSFKNVIIGSGPTTFEYQYLLHQPEDIVQGPWWQTRFTQGRYALATWLTEFGVLGLIGFLLILLTFLYRGLKLTILSKQPEQSANQTLVQSTTTVLGFYFLLFWFLYSADFFLLVITFLILGLWLKSTNLKRKHIIFNKSPQQAFLIMLLSIVIIAAAAVGFYYSGKKYIAAINYNQVLESISQEDFNIDSAVDLLTKAVNLDSTNDLYLRELSEAYLIKLGQIQNNQLLTPEQKQPAIQLAISQLEGAIMRMLAVNPANSQNWDQAAKIYSNLMVLDFSAYQLAVNNFNKVKELNPTNPVTLLSLANLNFELVKGASNQLEQENIEKVDKDELQTIYEQNLAAALDNADAAIKLKNNYTPAYYFKAMVYEFDSQNDLALANYQVVLQFEPNNQEIIDKIKALQELTATEPVSE